jgi:hypothetical protein
MLFNFALEYALRRVRGEVPTGFWCGDLRETDHVEVLGIDGSKILKWIFRK